MIARFERINRTKFNEKMVRIFLCIYMGLRQKALGVLNDNIFNLVDYFLKAVQPLINMLKEHN